ncbi:MAG: hypothetical protein ACJAZ7_000275 [Zhongshania aliphaticivorans]|jgi:hypothetical protein
MKIPEFLVFAKFIAVGFLIAEVWQLSFHLAENSYLELHNSTLWVKIGLILAGLLLCLTYAVKRDALAVVTRMACSLRIDLLIAIGIGVWIDILALSWLTNTHLALKNADPQWAPSALFILCALLLSPIIQHYRPKPKRPTQQLYFISDDEIDDPSEDMLESEAEAKSFAEAVLKSGAHNGLVVGVDGPWGVGKTSFINLAARYWERSEEKVIVCRLEPLRYASQPDLADRFIRELSVAIRRKAFAPEFRPAASRYSRLIKGKAEFSFLGFRLSLEPSQETADELLDDLDEVLRSIGHRVIIVIDDLDRLDATTTNNVLFTARRTFKLSQATYILCYDTEILAGNDEEGTRAREFLEKFVTVKLSLFVDSSSISNFLRRDWQLTENHINSIPSDTMWKLGSILNELADILDGESAAKYLPLIGDMRKVKRFVNAMLLMQIEKSDLGRTDFNKRDLINLMLLHLNYPGQFRRIYSEETEGRSGVFSVFREYGAPSFKNSDQFPKMLESAQESPSFLLKQLFDVKTLELTSPDSLDEGILASRACFNQGSHRNLEGYLKLIVRFATPEPQETFALYHAAVEKVRKGTPINSVLTSNDFRFERTHDRFWSVLVNQSHDFTYPIAEDAINSLVDSLPRYSLIEHSDRGLRKRAIYSLLQLLDRAGWGRTLKRRRENSAENVIEIAFWIFGEKHFEGKGLIQRIASDDRGVLGWNDLMLFRLQCCADRQGQLYNLHSALAVHQDQNAETSGQVSRLTLTGMRGFSQKVFETFKRTYIDPQRNFFTEVNNTPNEDFLGRPFPPHDVLARNGDNFIFSDQSISAVRSAIKGFVIYQLSNNSPPKGSGVGCGLYDESGDNDAGEIAKLMNEYVFDFCFNPDINDDNTFLFLDYCLSNLSSSFFHGEDDDGFVATHASLSGGFNSKRLAQYWSQHRSVIRNQAENTSERLVVTHSYIASYADDLEGVFAVLDEMASQTFPTLSG